MKHRLLTGLLAGAAALTLAVSAVAPAAAGPTTPNRGRYAALGDSYAAGVGNTPLPRSGDSGRSSEAYPVLLAGAANKVTFLAESGATTVSVLQEQVPMVPGGARQITLTVGGNDVGFGTVAITCATTPAACSTALAGSAAALVPMRAGLESLIEALQAKAPNATIYVTGYPKLFQPLNPAPSVFVCPALSAVLPGVDPANLALADSAVLALNATIAAEAAENGAVYVDVTAEFEGFGLCTAPGSLINPPISASPGEFAPASLHPTAAGQEAYAAAVEDAGFVTG